MVIGITAHMQQRNMHMCLSREFAEACNCWEMKVEKTKAAKERAVDVVQRWAARIAKAKDWAPTNWAKAAGVSGTTITRTMKSGSTTKIENLHILAKAAGIPSVLDFLESQVQTSASPNALHWSPNGETVQTILEVVLNASPQSHVREDDLPLIAHGIALAIADFATDPAREHEPGFRDGVLLGVARALRDYKQPPSVAA